MHECFNIRDCSIIPYLQPIVGYTFPHSWLRGLPIVNRNRFDRGLRVGVKEPIVISTAGCS